MNRNTYQQGISAILKAALSLFQENGFTATSIRQIANRADMSLGLINHYFGSKELLGARCLQLIDSYVTQRVDDFADFSREPILYDLVMVRTLFSYIQREYRQFYLDSLEHDLFFKYLSSRPPTLIYELQKHYPIETDEDSIILFSRYMPYMLEKTLMLKKAQGLFSSISYDQVPLLVCSSAMGHFIPEADVRAQDEEAIRLSQTASNGLRDTVPDEFTEEYASRNAEKIRRTVDEMKSQ